MNREWMYRRSTPEGDFNPQFLDGLESFIEFACSKPAFMNGENIRCPCRKCHNRKLVDISQDDAIYAKWAKKASIRYSDFMTKMKSRRRTGEGPPKSVGVEVWTSWEAYWDTEKAQSLARQARQNRLSEPDGEGTGQIRHRGGSRSASAHAIALAEQSGDPLASSVYATFRRFHVSATGEYTDAKSRRIGEEVERRIALASQPLPDGTLPPPVDANEIYLEVTGGPTKKHRVFGLGSMYSGTPAAHPGSSSQFMAPPAFTEQQIDDRVRERMEAECAQIVSDMETRMQEREDKLRQEMREQMDTLLNTFIHSATRPSGSSS